MDLRILFREKLRELINYVIFPLDYFYEDENSIVKIMVYERASLLIHFDMRGIRYYIVDDSEHEIANQVVFLVFDLTKELEEQLEKVSNALIEFYADKNEEIRVLVENPEGY